MTGRPIDEKIVAMRLDNEQFKQKARETVSIFDKIKSSFSNIRSGNLSKATNDVASLNRAASGFDPGPMTRGIEAIASRFSTLGVIGTTALTNITNKAVDAGMRIQKSLTTDQVFGGFREYELKMRSIGTMLSNTQWAGSTLDDVKATLEQLNNYADKTIYSFGEMTTAIGRFTAAGVTLEDSATAIKGLGNLAAASGSDVHQLNTAMYQVSQGLAAGRFGLEDWNSMVNAGMGGKKTQDALLKTAKAMGQNVDMSDGFRLSLQQGWLTSEVFLETLKEFGNDESMTEAATSVRTFTGMMDSLKESIGSGWATSWELIFGDFEEATRLWTGLSKIIGGVFQASTDARNDFLRALIDSGALQVFGQSVKLAFTPILLIFKAAQAAFRTIFPPLEATSIMDFLSGIKQLVSSVQLSEKSIQNIKIVFTGLFAVLGIGYEAIKMIGDAIVNLIPGVGSIGAGILSLIAYIFKIPIAIHEAITSGKQLESTGGALSNIFKAMSVVIGAVVGGLIYLGSVAAQTLGILFSGNYTGGPLGESSSIVEFLTGVGKGFQSLIQTIGNFDVVGMASSVVNFFVSIKDGVISLKDAVMGIDEWFGSLWDIIAANQGWILAGGGLTGLAAILWKLWEVFDAVTKPLTGFGEILENAGDALGAFTLAVHAKSLVTVAIAVGILAASFMVLSSLDSKQITTGLYMIVGSLSAVVGALFLLSKYDITGSFAATMSIIGLAGAVLLMAEAIEKMSELNYAELTKGIIGLVAILGTLTGAMVIMSKYNGGMLQASAAQFVAIAISIHLLLSAIAKIGDIDVGTIAKGVATIGVLLLELGLFLKIAAGPVFGPASAVGLMGIAVALKMMTSSVEEMGSIDVDTLKQGLVAIAALLASIGIFSRAVASAGLLASGAGIALLGVALNLLVAPIQALGSMDFGILAQGLGAIAVALGAIALASQFMVGLIPAAIGIGLLAVSLTALIAPIAAFGAMEWDTMVKGMTAMILVIGLIAATSSLLAPAVVPMLAFSGALAVLGLGVAAAGIGLAAFAKGLILLATLSSGAVVAIVATLTALITGFSTILPAATDLFLKIFASIVDTIERMIPRVNDAITKMLLTLMDKIEENGPKLMQGGADMLISLIEGLEKEAPRVMTSLSQLGTTLVVSFLQNLESNASKIIATGADVIVKFLDGVSVEIPRVINRMAEFVIEMIEGMTESLQTNGPIFTDAVLGLMAEVLIIVATAGSDVIRALFGWIPGVNEAMESVSSNAEAMIRENFGAEKAGSEKGEEFASGIVSSEELVLKAGKTLAESGEEGASSVKMTTTGEDFGNGFAIGISNTLETVGRAALSLAKKAYNKVKEELDINSPAGEMIDLGQHTGEGFKIGLEQKSGSVIGAILGWTTPAKESVKTVNKEIEKEAVKTSSNTGKKAVESGYKSASKANTKAKKTAKKEVVKTAEEIAREARDAFREKMEDLDYRYEMGEIDTDKYVMEIGKLRDSYSSYRDLVRDANLKIKDVEEKQAKNREELRKKEEEESKAQYERMFNERKSLINEQKHYNELSLTRELAAWEQMQTYYEAGTEERKEADREVYRLKNELNDKMLQKSEEYVEKVRALSEKLISDEKALRDKYYDAIKDKTADLSGFTGLFDAVKKDSETTGVQLLSNLRSQVRTLDEWAEDISQLSKKGINEGLLDTLRAMGPSAHSEIDKLTRLTRSQLDEYSELWLEKNNKARKLAINELEGMKEDTITQINQLRVNASTQLDIYKAEWLAKIREVRFGTSGEFVKLTDSMGDIGKNSIEALIEGMSSMEGPLSKMTDKLMNSVTSTIQNSLGIAIPQTEINAIKDNVKKSSSTMTKGYNSVWNDDTITKVVDGNKGLKNTSIPTPNTTIAANSIKSIETTKKVKEVLDFSSLGKTISGAIGKLQNGDNSPRKVTVPVYLDGNLITEVVSENQNRQTSLSGVTKGVII